MELFLSTILLVSIKKLGEGNVKVKARHRYSQPGTYRVVVKITDIFGGETSKEIIVNVGG